MALPTCEFDFEHHTEEITEFGWPWHGRWDGSFDNSHEKLLDTNNGLTIQWPAMPEPTPEITTGVVRFYGSVKANLSPIAKTLAANAAENAEGMLLSKYAIYSGKDSILYNQNMYNKWVFIDEKDKPWLCEILPGGFLNLVEFGVFDADYYDPKVLNVSISNYNPQWIKVDDITKRGNRALLTNWTLTATELGKDGIIEALTRKQYMGVYEIIITGYYDFDTGNSTLSCSMTALKEGAQLTPVVNPSLPPRTESFTYSEVAYTQYVYAATRGTYINGVWSDVVYEWSRPTTSAGGKGTTLSFDFCQVPSEYYATDLLSGGLYGNATTTDYWISENYIHYIPYGTNLTAQITEQMTPEKIKYVIGPLNNPKTWTFTTNSVSSGWSVTNRYIGCFYDQDDVVQHVTFDIKREQGTYSTPDFEFMNGCGPYLNGSNNYNIGCGNFAIGYHNVLGKLAILESGSFIQITSYLKYNEVVVDTCVGESKDIYTYTNTVNKDANAKVTTSVREITEKIDGTDNNNIMAFPIQYSNTLYGLAFPGPGAGKFTWRQIHGKWGNLASKETVTGFKVQASENPITGEVVRSSLPVCFV